MTMHFHILLSQDTFTQSVGLIHQSLDIYMHKKPHIKHLLDLQHKFAVILLNNNYYL